MEKRCSGWRCIHTVNARVAVEQFMTMLKAKCHRTCMPSYQRDSCFSSCCVPDHQVFAAHFDPWDNYCFILLRKAQPWMWVTACWECRRCSASRCDCSPALWLWPPLLAPVGTHAGTGSAVVSVGLWSPVLMSDMLDPSTATVSHVTGSQVAWCFTYIAVTFLFFAD